MAALSLMADLGYGAGLVRLARHLPGRDFTGHFLLMGALSFFVNLGLASQPVFGRRVGAVGWTLLLLFVVALEEASHLFLSHRTFEWSDLEASYAGVLVFALLAACLRVWRRPSATPGRGSP